MPEQVFTLGRNNEIILTFVPNSWLLELYNDEPIPVKLKITKQGVTKDSIKTDIKKHSTYTPKSYGEY